MTYDSKLAQIVSQAVGKNYRTGSSPVEVYTKLQHEAPELHAGLMRLAREELTGAIVIQTETKFDWPRHLQNQVEIEEDGREYAYLGEAVELWMQGLNIKGKARLSKLEKHKTIKNNWKVTNWFPPIIEAQPQTRTSYTPLWSFESNEYCNFVSSRGMVERDYKWSCDYRGALNGGLLNMGINLPHQLFEKVFAPIDAQLLKIYQEVSKEKVSR